MPFWLLKEALIAMLALEVLERRPAGTAPL